MSTVKIVVVFLDSLSCFSKFTEGLFRHPEAQDSVLDRHLYFLLNYCGQPFTVYGSPKNCFNLYVAETYNRLLAKVLHENALDFDAVELKVVAFGSGSLNAVTFGRLA